MLNPKIPKLPTWKYLWISSEEFWDLELRIMEAYRMHDVHQHEYIQIVQKILVGEAGVADLAKFAHETIPEDNDQANYLVADTLGYLLWIPDDSDRVINEIKTHDVPRERLQDYRLVHNNWFNPYYHLHKIIKNELKKEDLNIPEEARMAFFMLVYSFMKPGIEVDERVKAGLEEMVAEIRDKEQARQLDPERLYQLLLRWREEVVVNPDELSWLEDVYPELFHQYDLSQSPTQRQSVIAENNFRRVQLAAEPVIGYLQKLIYQLESKKVSRDDPDQFNDWWRKVAKTIWALPVSEEEATQFGLNNLSKIDMKDLSKVDDTTLLQSLRDIVEYYQPS